MAEMGSCVNVNPQDDLYKTYRVVGDRGCQVGLFNVVFSWPYTRDCLISEIFLHFTATLRDSYSSNRSDGFRTYCLSTYGEYRYNPTSKSIAKI
eukprot:15331740-Ditylum_brightwellii.AAC.1